MVTATTFTDANSTPQALVHFCDRLVFIFLENVGALNLRERQTSRRQKIYHLRAEYTSTNNDAASA
jgi:hypothetical protein